jgi:hypothetical protein
MRASSTSAGALKQDDVVELGIELPLVALAAGHEQLAGVVAGEQVGDGLLAPYPVQRSVRQRHPVTPPIGVGVDRPVSSCAEDLQDR